MQLALVNGDKQLVINFDGFRVDSIEEISALMTEAGKLFNTYDNHVCHCKEKSSSNAPTHVPAPPQERDFSVRERLPNNVVDLSTLNVKQAKASNVLVRCPSCGQSHCVMVKLENESYFMRKDYKLQEFIIIGHYPVEFDCIKHAYIQYGEKPNDYFKRIQSMGEINSNDFNVSPDTELFCPICGKGDEFKSWNDAWEHPEKYFEHEHICEACGGECSLIVSKDNTDNHMDKYKCETCGSLWDD